MEPVWDLEADVDHFLNLRASGVESKYYVPPTRLRWPSLWHSLQLCDSVPNLVEVALEPAR